jgi:hypothetical protein
MENSAKWIISYMKMDIKANQQFKDNLIYENLVKCQFNFSVYFWYDIKMFMLKNVFVLYGATTSKTSR